MCSCSRIYWCCCTRHRSPLQSRYEETRTSNDFGCNIEVSSVYLLFFLHNNVWRVVSTFQLYIHVLASVWLLPPTIRTRHIFCFRETIYFNTCWLEIEICVKMTPAYPQMWDFGYFFANCILKVILKICYAHTVYIHLHGPMQVFGHQNIDDPYFQVTLCD